MKSFSIISILLFVCISSAFGQETKQDSTWNLKNLDYGKYGNLQAQAFKNTKLFKESHGWFPKSTINLIQVGFIPMSGSDNFDVADNIRSKAFIPTINPFSGKNFLKSKEREIYKPKSQEIYKSDSFIPIIGKLFSAAIYPITAYSDFGFDFLYSPNLPVNIYSKLVATKSSGLLFAKEPKKHYINYNGEIKQFTEASIINLNEWSINTGFAFELPIYGAFINAQNSLANSYYYITLGPSIDYIIWSNATQYLQIADAKNDLRYNNGQDTFRLQSEVVLKGINRLRYGIDITLGWKLTGSSTGFGIEIFSYLPLSSVIDDAIWKQYRVGLRWKIMYSGLYEK